MPTKNYAYHRKCCGTMLFVGIILYAALKKLLSFHHK